MAPYDAIYFDLDSTLCEPTAARDALLQSAFDQAGVEQFCSVAQLRHASQDVRDAQTDREFFEQVFAATARRVGADPATAPDLADAYLDVYDPRGVRFRPGAERALEYASERGPVGLITNGSEETQSQKLAALGVTDLFDTTVFVDPRNGVPPKPDPAPFERALGALSVDPSAALHVGDNRYADIGGANRVGMDSAWIDLGHGAGEYDDGEYGPEHEPTYELETLETFDRIV
ncbi:HAD family hydrolase [Halobacteria archaeon AArc-dxtr1]|nr:HAD family hydrolase [Halobacteria archaeon AArc-dxtr1]